MYLYNKKNFIAKTIGLSLLATLVIGCSDDSAMDKNDMSAESKKETAIEHAEKHLDPNYVCPMHPQIVRGQPGTCPICGMDLVEVEQEEESSSKEKKVLYWVAPMDPNYRRDEPGKSPMGMDLVPVYDEGGGSDVKISAVVENNLGVRTAKVERDKLWRKIDTVGYIDFDENKITHIHLRTKGWIDKLYVKSEGERVKKGQLLFEVYSPELVNAQEEYVQALRSSNKRLIRASKERLISLGVSEKQISKLKQTRKVGRYVQVYAGQNGIVSELKVRQGMFVMPNKKVMSLADLSTIWVLAEVFESQADWVSVGQSADVSLPYKPGVSWEGSVEYIYPSLNPKTRTLRVRLRFDNPKEILKPNMFSHITIYGGAKKNVLIVPREAVIRTGENTRVILAMGEGKYRAKPVTMGIESGDWIEIKDGLLEGDMVVTSGQFLIDSEASLKASIARMQSGGNDKSKMMDMKKSEMIMGTGVIMKVMPSDSKVNMSHDPIEQLGWPDMTMDFYTKKGVDLSKFKPNDEVEFELEKGADGYEIKSMRSRSDNSMNMPAKTQAK